MRLPLSAQRLLALASLSLHQVESRAAVLRACLLSTLRASRVRAVITHLAFFKSRLIDRVCAIHIEPRSQSPSTCLGDGAYVATH